MDDCPQEAPLFTFGVIADVQYADLDDGYNYSRTRKRYYRTSLQLLRNAVESWSETSAVKPEFVLQLGDIIDGFNKGRGDSERALDAVLRELSPGPAVHHVWGNHEFYNFSRSELLRSKLNTALHTDRSLSGVPARPDIYAYHFSPFPGFRFVVLDAYDVSLLGIEESSERYINALSLIKQHNNNTDLNCPPGSQSSTSSLGHDRTEEDSQSEVGNLMFTMFNGGYSKDQLNWLDSVLSSADEKQERVTIVSHLPAHPRSTDPVCLAWNFGELLVIIHSHSSVVCYMAGHAHDGGYYQDQITGVHHLTLAGVIETPPDSNAFGTVSVYKDRMVMEGKGRMEDRVFVFQ